MPAIVSFITSTLLLDLMTYFFSDIKILCVQNNKAHFLLDIKLNGNLTYKRKDEWVKRSVVKSKHLPLTSKVVRLGWMRIV